MIKVGRIYKHQYSPRRICVTYIDEEEITVIRNDGKVYNRFHQQDIDFWWELIAEYPTWQEAVNSEYFKND